MTHLRLKYVQAFVDRKTGGVFRYFRRPGFPHVRLPGLPGSAEFMDAYQAALAGAQRSRATIRRWNSARLPLARKPLAARSWNGFARNTATSRWRCCRRSSSRTCCRR